MKSNIAASAAEQGLISTSELSRRLGFYVQSTWLVDVLKVRPAMSINGGGAVYWRTDQLVEIASALIARLADFMGPPDITPIKPDEYGNLPEALMLLEHEAQDRRADDPVRVHILAAEFSVNQALMALSRQPSATNEDVAFVPPGIDQVIKWARAYVDNETTIGECKPDQLTPEECDGLAELKRLESLLALHSPTQPPR